jgi:hypothetical protein
LASQHTRFATFIDSAEASTRNFRQHEVNMALQHLGEDRGPHRSWRDRNRGNIDDAAIILRNNQWNDS